jgi:PAS domain S-box-containing protein
VRSPLRLFEKVVCVSLFTVTVVVMFRAGPWPQTLLLNVPYVAMIPFLLWAGLRLDVRVASLLTVILVTIGAWSTLHGHGPFVVKGSSDGDEIVAFQMSAILWGMSALALSAVTAERRNATAALVESEARARNAEREALESHARVHAIFDHAEAVIYMKDLDGRYVAVNRAFERALKLKADDVVGRRDEDLFPDEMARRFRQTDDLVMRNGQTFEYEIESTLEGARGVFWSVKFPIRDLHGRVTAVCGMTTDITARKQAERDLQAAKNAAEEASRAKSDFLANISHEIRTPLTAILGYADVMLAPRLADEQRIHNAQTIRRNGEHLLSILNDVLDMSKIEAGRMTIEHVDTPLPEVMAEVMSLMHHRATEKGLALAVECRTPIPVRILSDPTKLRQIMMNLVGNAVKFTSEGTVTLALAMEHGAAGGELVVDVIDTGIGMSTDQLALLGQPFTQGDPSHARRFGGSGLGLSICYRLAQLMGGSMSCRSKVGVGSTLTLRLPTGDVTGMATVLSLPDVVDAPVQDEAKLDVATLTGRVLIAEDAADTRRLLEAYLRRTGVEVHTVDNGEAVVADAIAAWRSGTPYDLILMDVQMPRMDGVAATTALRSQGYKGCIVALTANAMDHDRARCIAVGCDGFLTKPIRRDMFLKAVRFYLTGTGPPTFPSMATAG